MPDNCEKCGEHIDTLKRQNLEVHHTDYSKPLDIVWLCHRCHIVEDVSRRAVEMQRDACLSTTTEQEVGSGQTFTLKQARKLRGLTQSRLARLARMAQAHICQIERGMNRWPTIATITKLGTALGMEPKLYVSGLVFEEKSQ